MEELKLKWQGPYSLDDPKQLALIPKGAFGVFIISAGGLSAKPRQDVHCARGDIHAELQVYMDDGKKEPQKQLFIHGIVAEVCWADVPKDKQVAVKRELQQKLRIPDR